MSYVKTYLPTLKTHVVNLKRDTKDLSRDLQRLEVRGKLLSKTLYSLYFAKWSGFRRCFADEFSYRLHAGYTEWSHVSDVFNLWAVEIDLFLLRWLRIYQQKLADRDNRTIARWRYLTKTTRIHFVFALLFKFLNPAEDKRTIALICTRNNKLKDSGSCSKMTSSCTCPISFIMLCNILTLKSENMERLSRNF